MAWSNTIADILQQQGQQGAETARAIANIASTAALNRGRIIGGAVNDVGQAIASLPYQKAKLQEEAGQAQIRDLTAQKLQGELSDEALKRQKSAQIQSILQQHGDDLPGAIKDIMGVDAPTGLALSQHWNDVQTQATKFQMEQLDAQRQRTNFLEQRLSQSTDQPSYTKQRAIVIQAGLATPDQLPESFDEALPQIKQLSLSVMSAKDRYELQQKQIEDNIKTEDERRKQAADAAKAANAGKEKNIQLVVPGPNGQPVTKLFSQEDVKAGVPTYKAPPAAAGPSDARNDRSYQFTSTQLEKLREPLAQSAERMSRLIDSVNQHTPQADAVVAPALLTVMAGGMGSGLRINEAEIARIVGGRTNLESLKAAINKWSIDPSKGLSITEPQREQIRALVGTVNDKLQKKLQAVDAGGSQLATETDPMKHRLILDNVHKSLESIDSAPVSSGSSDELFQQYLNRTRPSNAGSAQ